MAAGTTHATSVLVDLPPSGRGESYSFELAAKHAGLAVGQLKTFGESGHGWDLRFRVARCDPGPC